MDEEDTKTEFPILKYLKEHPAIAGSFVYFLVTAIGVIYAWSLYRKFQINIFDYAETNDFLMAAFKTPGVFLMTFMMGVLAFIAVIGLTAKYGNQSFSMSRFTIQTKIRISFSVIIVLLLFFIIPFVYAWNNAITLTGSKVPTITVLYEEGKQGSTSVVKELESSLIGSTEKFMFFYNHLDKRTIVIPVTKIISITTSEKKP